MEISRYASRLAPDSRVLPSGRPLQRATPYQTSPEIENGAAIPLEASRELPEEPDDAKLTGGTRSLSRRLLALNIPGMPVTSSTVADSGKAGRAAGVQPKPRSRKSGLGRSRLVSQDA